MSTTNPGQADVFVSPNAGTKRPKVVTLGAMAIQEPSAVAITGGAITGITDLAVADGGTGASNASGARTNLELVPGTHVQAYDAGLASIAGLTTAADKTIYTTASDTYAAIDLTSFGRSLIDDANASAGRSTLELGTIATQAASSVAITGGSVVGATIAGKVQEISAAGAISLDSNHVKLTGPAEGTYAVTLDVPSRGGQFLVIEMVATTSTNSVTLALTNVVGGSAATTATFDAAGEILTLMSASAKWVVLDEFGVTLA